MNAGPFPDSAPLGSLLEAGIDTIQVPPPPGYRFFGLSPVWLLARMPDGTFWEGIGATNDEAMADARRHWREWKHGSAMRREYRRRQAARGRRRR